MSFEPDNPKAEISIQELLDCIFKELKLLNKRFEDAFETGVEEEDIES